jgi:uncharacterized DUF497 family protein
MQHHRPCRGNSFEWDEHNSEKLGRRAIFPYEVEEVFADNPAWKRDKNADGPARYLMIGKTAGGRPLTVVVLCRDETRTLRAITGWDSSSTEVAYYRRRNP